MRCTVWYIGVNVLEGHDTSIFRVAEDGVEIVDPTERFVPHGFTFQTTKEHRMFISTRYTCHRNINTLRNTHASRSTPRLPALTSKKHHGLIASLLHFLAVRNRETESYFIAERSTKAEKENHLRRTQPLITTGRGITGFLDRYSRN
jgi:hypothetical protein